MKYSIENIDGNAFCLMGYTVQAMNRERFPQQQINEYKNAAMSSDYYNLVSVTWQQVEEVNDFVDFYNAFVNKYEGYFANKKDAAAFFLNEGNDVDAFFEWAKENNKLGTLIDEQL